MELKGVSKAYSDLQVLNRVNLEVKDHEIIAILGPSGCGKTTLLHIMSGLMQDYEGQIEGLDKHTVSYLFQDLRLLPWKNVKDNMSFVLKGKIPKNMLEEHINKFLRLVGLEDYGEYALQALSGGMQQRLSLARAFAYPSSLLLMDEPFKSLDYETRHHIMEDFKELWIEEKKTVIFITHDIRNALQLGDHVYLLSDKPSQIIRHYENPLPLKERSFHREELLQLEKQIYIDFIQKEAFRSE